MYRSDDHYGLRVETEIAAHDAYPVVAMPGKIAERTVDAAKQPRLDQFELDLFEGAAMKLLRDLDLQVAGTGGSDNCIGFAQLMRNRRFEQHMQPSLDCH